jgi:hypothetical protein
MKSIEADESRGLTRSTIKTRNPVKAEKKSKKKRNIRDARISFYIDCFCLPIGV